MKSPTCFYEKGASNELLLRSTILKILTEFRLITVECRCILTSTHVCFEEKSYNYVKIPIWFRPQISPFYIVEKVK